MIQRRGFIAGLGALLAAPAIVRAASIMPVRRPALVVKPTISLQDFADRIMGPHIAELSKAIEESLFYGNSLMEVMDYDGLISVKNVPAVTVWGSPSVDRW